ncbi:hypothetical protein ACFTXB_04210 [Streptomyces sp. NPDC057074]|uniref:hypothetical protein n=1 Tax=Streptomyces sp. NPDC057074 TaxID=3346015 RepID=UPI003632F077
MSDHEDAVKHAEFNEEDIRTVTVQGEVSREEAVKALVAAQGDPVAALIDLGR